MLVALSISRFSREGICFRSRAPDGQTEKGGRDSQHTRCRKPRIHHHHHNHRWSASIQTQTPNNNNIHRNTKTPKHQNTKIPEHQNTRPTSSSRGRRAPLSSPPAPWAPSCPPRRSQSPSPSPQRTRRPLPHRPRRSQRDHQTPLRESGEEALVGRGREAGTGGG